MRFVVAQRHGLRGEGLGNELIPWAKGWIASQKLEARLVGPSWGLNRRRYWRNFGTSRLDFLLEDGLCRLPHHEFTARDFYATRETDFGAAIESWALNCGLARSKSFLVSVSGMWGGYLSVRSARPFLLAKLLNSRDALRSVYQVHSQLKPKKLFVAVHMRSSINGFSTLARGDSAQGKFNFVVPPDWYLWVCEALQQRYGQQIQFRFFTDRVDPHFKEAVHRFNSGQSAQDGLTECSDLLLMAQADLRVCSVSSYSLAASFLSGGPYLWYKPQLTVRNDFYTLWGHEMAQQENSSPSSAGIEFLSDVLNRPAEKQSPPINFVGTAMDIGDPLPENLVKQLDHRLCSLDSRTNLLEYGCIPISEERQAGACSVQLAAKKAAS
jgi:hypothetical protein